MQIPDKCERGVGQRRPPRRRKTLRVCVYACVRVRAHAYVSPCMRMCARVRVCVCVGARVRVCVCVCAWVRVRVHAYVCASFACPRWRNRFHSQGAVCAPLGYTRAVGSATPAWTKLMASLAIACANSLDQSGLHAAFSNQWEREPRLTAMCAISLNQGRLRAALLYAYGNGSGSVRAVAVR